MSPVNDPSRTALDARLETVRRDVPLRDDLWPRIAAELDANRIGRDAGSRDRGSPGQRWQLPAIALAASVVLASLVLLLRPDGHVAGRWHAPEPATLRAALDAAACRAGATTEATR